MAGEHPGDERGGGDAWWPQPDRPWEQLSPEEQYAWHDYWQQLSEWYAAQAQTEQQAAAHGIIANAERDHSVEYAAAPVSLTSPEPSAQKPAVQKSAAPAGRRRVIRTLSITAAVLFPAITIASIGVPLLANMDQRNSSAETFSARGADDGTLLGTDSATEPEPDLEVIGVAAERHAREVNGIIVDWQMPTDAPFESLPLNFVEGQVGLQCSAEQNAWLSEHAKPMRTSSYFGMALHNTANAGDVLSLENIRFDGSERDSAPWVYFQCLYSGMGGGDCGQPILIDITGQPAVYAPGTQCGQEQEFQPEGSPVVINIPSGAIHDLALMRSENVDTQQEYEGRFVADVLGTGETVVLQESVEFFRERVPGYRLGFVYMSSDPDRGKLLCGRPDPAGTKDYWGRPTPIDTVCSMTEARELLREAAASVN